MQKISSSPFDFIFDELSEVTTEPILETVMKKYYKAIDDRLAEILAAGISMARIRLQVMPDGKTEISIDGIPNSEFFIDYQGLGPTPSSR